MRRSASFENFLRGRAILDGGDRLARVILEVAENTLELFLHVANLGLLLFLAFIGQVRLLARQFLLLRPDPRPLFVKRPQIGMQAVEKA